MAHVKNFGAVGDGKHDDTQSLQHALDTGERLVVFPRGVYRLTRPLVVDLDKVGLTGITGDGGTATLLMDGLGPALRLIGAHGGTADPLSVKPAVWARQRMPTVSGLEIVGAHDEAVGIELNGTMQATLTGLLIRQCRYGVHLIGRNRNLLLSHSHIYHGRGPAIGVYFDGVNLHQANIVGCHISYHAHAGIKIARSEIRNLQITGCDIEYNFDPAAQDSADVWIDSRAGTVREGTIASCTIQAKYSPGGCNVRMEGGEKEQSTDAGLWTITGNVIQSQHTNLLLRRCRGVVVTGNSFCSAEHRSIVVDRCRNVAVGVNTIDYNPDYPGARTDGVVVTRSAGIALNGLNIESCRAGNADSGGPIEVAESEDLTVANCQILAPVHRGIHLHRVQRAVVNGCLVRDRRTPPQLLESVLLSNSSDVELSGNLLEKGQHGTVRRK